MHDIFLYQASTVVRLARATVEVWGASRDVTAKPIYVWVGRGHIGGHLIIWAGAVRLKTAKKQKSKVGRRDGGTDRWTDGQTNRQINGWTYP